MPELEFKKNDKIRLGVEVEIQLIDPITGDLKPVGLQVLNSLKDEPNSQHIKSEIFQSMLEIDTPICEDAHEVGKSIRSSLALARKVAKKHEAEVMMSGTHPFAYYAERLLTPSGRYFTLVDRNQWISRRLQIFGLHVHLSMRDGEHAIKMNNALCHYLPTILALSASSPYWHKEDTGLASSRVTFFEAIPTGGHPYLLNNWNEFETLVEKLIFSKSITSLKDLWWDIRPNVSFGTIEIRIADCPPTVKEIEALVAYIHSLAVFIEEEILAGRTFSPPPEWILRENKWRASRHGINCDLIKDFNGRSISFLETWEEIKNFLRPVSQKFNYDSYFKFLEQVAEKGPSYNRQRKHYIDKFDTVIRHLIREGVSDQPEW